MLLIATALFVMAALLGLYLISFVLRDKATPKGIVFIHGPLAATGLLILIIYALLYKPAPIVSIIIFALAALGGLTMLYKDLTGQVLPKWMAIGHGIAAIIGLISLLIFIYY